MSGRDPTNDDIVESTIESIAASRKYRDLAEETIERVVRRRSTPSAAGLAKRARRELHHVLADYHVDRLRASAIDELTDAISAGETDSGIRARCAEVLACHATARERFPLLADGYYQKVFAVTGPPRSVVDLAAALHPFEWRWMDLPTTTTYLACDNNRRFVDAADRYLRAERAGQAVLCDILVDPPSEPFDLAFFLMTYHCLEDQQAGSGWDAISAVRARWVAVSLPVAGLGNRSKPKFAALAGDLEARLGEAGHHYRVQECQTERLYLIAKTEPRA
jgi:16S rRNA (guanine(1405)-N(7))-methyltransferase